MTTRDALIATIEADPADESARLVLSDWLEEHGELELARALREGPAAMSPVKEIDLAELLKDYDWAEVFADESSGNTTKNTDACPPGSDVDLTEPKRDDIAEILAAVNGENDGDEWVGVFRLKDGRYLLASGSCDYTGWD